MHYKLSARALEDLRDIASMSLDLFGEYQTQIYMSGLEYLFGLIADTPGMGTPWNKDRSVQRHPYKAHLVYYKIDDDGEPLILAIYHGRQPAPAASEL